MALFPTTAFASALAFTLVACAQYPAAPGRSGHALHHPPGAGAATATDRMAQMDAHMKAMRDMHEKMSRASTPQERQALMDEHRKLMREGMALMNGMGHGAQGGMPGMGGMGGMGGMQGMGPMGQMGPAGAPMDMATRQQMMEKRMEMMQSMMQSMMQMMMDRMDPPATRP